MMQSRCSWRQTSCWSCLRGRTRSGSRKFLEYVLNSAVSAHPPPFEEEPDIASVTQQAVIVRSQHDDAGACGDLLQTIVRLLAELRVAHCDPFVHQDDVAVDRGRD